MINYFYKTENCGLPNKIKFKNTI